MTLSEKQKNFQIYRAEKFIAAITQHTCPSVLFGGSQKIVSMVHGDGWYSNPPDIRAGKSCGVLKKQGIFILEIMRSFTNYFMKIAKRLVMKRLALKKIEH